MSELVGYISQFASSFFGVVESCFKLFFNDLPIIFGLRLGWWFLLFGLLGLLYKFCTE